MPNPVMERFTQRSRMVLKQTQEAAEQMGSTTIDSEHLLIGLSIEPHSAAGRALRSLGVNLSTIEITLHHNPFDYKSHPFARLELSADMRRILEYSVDEARRRGSQSINTEHLLFAILRLESCHAAQVLKALNVDSTRLHAEVHTLLTDPPPPELRTPLYDQPTKASPPPQSQYIQQAADESIKHTELLYNRISKRQKGPNLAITIGIGFLGTFLTAWWSDNSLDLVAQYPALNGLRIALNLTSWFLALILPALAAGLSSIIVMKDIQPDSLALLRLTNVNPRSLIWGYVRGMLYRLRLLFPPVMMIVPLMSSSLQQLLPQISLTAQRQQLATPVMVMTLLYVTSGFLLWTLLAFIWSGITLGVALSFKFKESNTAGAAASLIMLIGMPSTLILTLIGGTLLLSRQIDPNDPTFFGSVEGLLFIPPFLAFLSGLWLIYQGQNWIAPDSDDSTLKHPLDK